MHHSSMSWDITPLYFFSRNLIYFQQKKPIKVQVWWNFTWEIQSLKFCTLMGSLCSNHIKFQLKRIEQLSLMTLKSDEKFTEKLTCGFKYDKELGEFLPNHSKVWKFHFDELFLSKVHKVWVKKIWRSYILWQWTVMKNLNKPWLCGFKNGMRNWADFH